jgi:hypothetical protein
MHAEAALAGLIAQSNNNLANCCWHDGMQYATHKSEALPYMMHVFCLFGWLCPTCRKVHPYGAMMQGHQPVHWILMACV